VYSAMHKAQFSGCWISISFLFLIDLSLMTICPSRLSMVSGPWLISSLLILFRCPGSDAIVIWGDDLLKVRDTSGLSRVLHCI
jgi:hypothetical protein